MQTETLIYTTGRSYLTYTTGRNYGAEQVLRIEYPDATDPMADDFDVIDVAFIDGARGIAGKCRVFRMQLNQRDLGRAVLAEYDAGRYDLL